MAIIKPLSTQIRYPVPGQNSTIDNASIIRVLNGSTGGTYQIEIRTIAEDGGSTIGSLDIAPLEVVYIRKDPSHYVNTTSSLLEVCSVAVNPNPGSV